MSGFVLVCLLALQVGPAASKPAPAPASAEEVEQFLQACNADRAAAHAAAAEKIFDRSRAKLREAARRACAFHSAPNEDRHTQLLSDLAVELLEQGDAPGALPLFALARERCEAVRSESDDRLHRARENHATALKNVGDYEGARALYAQLIAAEERVYPDDAPMLAHARLNYASVLSDVNQLEPARKLIERVIATYEKTLPPNAQELLSARIRLGQILLIKGEFKLGRDLLLGLVDDCKRTLPADAKELENAQLVLAACMDALDDHAGAYEREREALEQLRTTCEPDARSVLSVEAALALPCKHLGRFAEARTLEEHVLAVRLRVLPHDHIEVQWARENLSSTLFRMGQLEEARALQEQVVDVLARDEDSDSPNLLLARANLGASLSALGDFAAAREIEELVLASRERLLAEDDPLLQDARTNLAITLKNLGDLPAARILEERVLASEEATHAPGSRQVSVARANLARTLGDGGDLAGALALEEQVLATCEMAQGAEHPGMISAQRNLAATLLELGRYEEALVHARIAAEASARGSDRLAAAGCALNLSAVLEALDRHDEALHFGEQALAGLATSLPVDDPLPIHARENLAAIRTRQGPKPVATLELEGLATAIETLFRHTQVLAPREICERANQASSAISILLASTLGLESNKAADQASATDSTLAARIFALTEIQRVLGSGQHSMRPTLDPSTLENRARMRDLRGRIGDLVAGSALEPQSAPTAPTELAELVRQLDAAESDVARSSGDGASWIARVGTRELARNLSAGACFVGYHAYTRRQPLPADSAMSAGEERLTAHVLRADGRLERVELGELREIEEAVSNWREAIGARLVVPSGAVPEAKSVPATTQAARPTYDPAEIAARGKRLRQLVLDPVLRTCGDARELHVCLDDALHLVPLDALPFEDAGGATKTTLVGQHMRILVEVSCLRLLEAAPALAPSSEPSLLALGGADFDARTEESDDATAAMIAPPLALRFGQDGERRIGEAWIALPGTQEEALDLGRIFHGVFGREAQILLGKDASKAALSDRVRGARFVHVATHGYFAPESVPTASDSLAGSAGRPRANWRDTVRGFAPMTLCGLALAGANRGMDKEGRVHGVMTAEELAGLDLSQCELATLSACETNVGVRRAGLGIRSLEAALRAAGAQSSLTSLWKVDDARARELVEDFYRRVWVDKQPKAEALWAAKMDLIEQRVSVRDWAGWILTGDPR